MTSEAGPREAWSGGLGMKPEMRNLFRTLRCVVSIPGVCMSACRCNVTVVLVWMDPLIRL